MGKGGSLDTTASDDYRHTQRIAVVVRWFLLATWFLVLNYRTDVTLIVLLTLNAMGGLLAMLNGYVHWRIRQRRPINRVYVLALSAVDLTLITVGIVLTSRFQNTFFVFYYPALLGVSLVLSSPFLSFGVVTLVAILYATMSILLEPGVNPVEREEGILIVRIVTMFAVVAAASLMTRIEQRRRLEAVEVAQQEGERNLELQRRAQKAELAAQEERTRIAREIHDGIAQSIYMLSLQLETASETDAGLPEMRQKLEKLVALSKQTLLEVRHYIFDLKPYLTGEKSLATMLENQVLEFDRVAGVPTVLDTKGDDRQVPPLVAACLYRVTQEALANVFKHAEPSLVQIHLEFSQDAVQLTVGDNGRGFDPAATTFGHGVQNMRRRVEELGGTLRLSSALGRGTTIVIHLPC